MQCTHLYLAFNTSGLVILPSFILPEQQRDLIRWSLKDHAQNPNETNLDTHYILPEEGLWNTYLRAQDDQEDVQDIQPRASTSYIVPPPLSGPRQLISNEPASKENFHKLVSTPATPAPPSPNLRPCPPEFLIPKLRWANIGWYYHWGNKQYDFTRGKIPVSEKYADICKRAVKAVPWDQVFNAHDGDIGDWKDEPRWDTWAESYGELILG